MQETVAFIDEPVKVEYETARVGPTAVVLNGVRRPVSKVIREWQDYHTPAYADHAQGWLHRRHRNYYLVRLDNGDVVELYLDRAGGRRDWVLLKLHLPSLQTLVLGQWDTNGYVLSSAGCAVVVDPAGDAERIMAALGSGRATAILLTHGHPDHTGALETVRRAAGAPVFCHPLDAAGFGIHTDGALEDGRQVEVGDHVLVVAHTPGHTPGSVCLRFDRRALVGDTLFPGGPGHSESPEALARLRASIRDCVLPWPDDTRILPGHGPGVALGHIRPAIERFLARELPPDACGDLEWDQV